MIHLRTFIVVAVAAAVLSFPAFAQKGRLNPNTATAEQLAAISGLDPMLAAAIQERRPFDSMTDFNALVRRTVTREKAERLYEKLFIPVNLNTGTEEEIELIPGMTDHMVGEFLEYRPYPDMQTFNSEIGKYVDDAEVARLRSYVTL